MNARSFAAALTLLSSGCVLREDFDRLARAKEKQAADLTAVRQQLTDARGDLSRQAAEELELRKQIAQLNEQLADLREGNRHLRDRTAAAERASQGHDTRLKTLRADHERALARLKESNVQALAARDARIDRLKERLRQLEELLARSRGPARNPSIGPGK